MQLMAMLVMLSDPAKVIVVLPQWVELLNITIRKAAMETSFKYDSQGGKQKSPSSAGWGAVR